MKRYVLAGPRSLIYGLMIGGFLLACALGIVLAGFAHVLITGLPL